MDERREIRVERMNGIVLVDARLKQVARLVIWATLAQFGAGDRIRLPDGRMLRVADATDEEIVAVALERVRRSPLSAEAL